MWIALLQRYYPIMSNSIVHTTWYSIRALPNIIYNIPICLHYVKFLAEEFRNSMHELLLYGLDLSVVGKCVSESPRVKSANRSSFSSGCGPFGLAFSAKRTSWPTSTISVHRQNAKQSVKAWEREECIENYQEKNKTTCF